VAFVKQPTCHSAALEFVPYQHLLAGAVSVAAWLRVAFVPYQHLLAAV
jgi:hypothetical protein